MALSHPMVFPPQPLRPPSTQLIEQYLITYCKICNAVKNTKEPAVAVVHVSPPRLETTCKRSTELSKTMDKNQ